MNKKYNKKNYNLNYYQQKTLYELQQRINLIILNSDKNLGPALIKRTKYISGMMNQSLLTNMFIQSNNDDIK